MVALAVLAAAFVILVAGGLALLAVAVAVVAVAVAATAAAAGAHLLIHRFSHLGIGGSAALVDREAEVLVHRAEHIIEQLTSLEETLAVLVVHHGLAQLVELGNLRLRRRHTLHMLVAQLLAVLLDLAEEIRRLGVLIKETDASLG